jgi:surface antigen
LQAPWILENNFYWGDVMHAKTMKAGTIVVVGALALAGCTGSQERVAAGGALGAGAGALIGGAVGGGRGALIGALIGGVAGLVIADAIEKERAREAAYIAARSGGSNVQRFRNSSGQAVIVRARTVRTYNNSQGQRIRVVERSVTREGKAAGTDQVEVNLATNEASGI